MGTDSTNTAFFFSRSEQRAPGGGLDKIHQFPRGPQKKSWLPSPPTTVNRKTGTLPATRGGFPLRQQRQGYSHIRIAN